MEIIQLVDLIMPIPVFLMTVNEAHMEYNSLIEQIMAKYELLGLPAEFVLSSTALC